MIRVRILCNDAVTTVFQWVGSAPRYDEWDSPWHLRSQPANTSITGGPRRLATDCLRPSACSGQGTRGQGTHGQGRHRQGSHGQGLAEHFNDYALLRAGAVVGRAKTYRGLGLSFLG